MTDPKTVRMPRQEYTEIAVLQTQVKNIEEDISEIKAEIKLINSKQEEKHNNTHNMLQSIKQESSAAHKGLLDKINVLEKWRWMLMGAGIVIGALGYPTIGKLLQ